ncbi:SDR family NAD(P)-dependent oxidoreductase [Muricoccus pecuniae]|uniref:NAD(P)-dependent dehydrogenase (Short-subunit alcohol dehydrogenase family) n=1 Tax=Muricoccus pecuniae TaxID=693023 RepID=A0A840YLE2_9PROT|nr:SDR family NAD(P)-dependent oxidoreductase [Roseomonas pecuniae]MBB5695493.1 NAD(P)-dependent dehydrogenase (short-subunit alcohol dehydrogenase family) [Roseomonas pecuniae]
MDVAQNKRIALVTGANQGIGFEVARALVREGFAVLVGARDPDRGQEAAARIGPGAVAIRIDVTDLGTIDTAAARVKSEFGRLDVLVQNAAIASAGAMPRSGEALARAGRPGVIPMEALRAVWETNVFGVVAVYQAMLPLLRATPGARVINVSSGAGSLTLNSDPTSPLRPLFDAGYAASKTALNGITLAMAIELEGEGIGVHAVSPGYTRTQLTGFAGTESPEEGAAEVVRLALAAPGGPTGTFSHATLGVLPW